MSGVDNPFNPGSGAQPPFFAGRNEEIAAFVTSLKSMMDGRGENFVLTGLRGTGKTVLLNEFDKICAEKKFFPIKRLQFTTAYNSYNMFADALKYDISAAMSSLSATKKIVQGLQSVKSQLKPKSVGIPELFYYEPSYEPTSIPFVNYIEDYLASNWQVFQKKEYKGVVFLYDEFHLISSGTDKESYILADLIGAINELQNKGFPYYLVLAGLPKLRLNVKIARSYSERMFKIMTLDNLSRDEAVTAISKPLTDSAYSFSSDLIDAIVEDAGQYPYFLQFYSKETIARIDKHDIELDDYTQVKDSITSMLDHDFFDQRLGPLSNGSKTILLSMAKMRDDDISFSAIVDLSGIDKRIVSTDLRRLEDKGLIYKYRRGMYRFTMPMFRSYLLRKNKAS